MQVTTNDMVLFWQTDTIYSNWHQPAEFRIGENTFQNSEAAFMYYKAIAFNDTAIALVILANQDPKTVKGQGRKIRSFDPKLWDEIKFEIMYDVCKAKFAQNLQFKKALLETGDRIMVEASPFDKIWGIGLAPNDPRALDQKNWQGENLLGKVLMQIRDDFRKEIK